MKLVTPITERQCGHLDNFENVHAGQPCGACNPPEPGARPRSWLAGHLGRLVEILHLDMSDESAAAYLTGPLYGEFTAAEVHALREKH